MGSVAYGKEWVRERDMSRGEWESVTCGEEWVRERDMSRGEWESVTCGEECARSVITCDEHLYVGDHPDTCFGKKHGLGLG